MTKRLHTTADLTHAAARRPLARRAPAPLVLEPRIMFDAAGVEAAVRHAAEHVTADAPAHAETAARSFIPAAVAAPAAPVDNGRVEVVFIEDNVNNAAQLVAAVRPGVEVIMLDHTRDGLQQMLAAMSGHAPVDAIHLVSHGATGQISLGTQTLSVDTIDGASAALARLGESMKPGADLLLYGCDVAQGATGAGFVERMAALTGADVAASTDITGSAAFAGNWTLEAHSGAIETKALELDRAGWNGELVNTVYDAQRNALTFAGAVSISGSGTGKSNGDVMRFNTVITIGGQAIDAVVTTTLDRATLSDYDSVQNPSNNGAYFQPNMNVTAAGGGASFKIDFYLGGTYTGAGTGIAVTLQNVVVNSYDIDSVGGNSPDRQFQIFQGFDSYELAATSFVKPHVQADGSVQFLYEATTPVNNGTITADGYRVKVYYDSMSSFVIKSGVAAASTVNFNGQAYFALDFSAGPNWTGATVKVDTPAPNLTYSATTFAEAAANDGTITTTATITLANGAFTGSDGAELAGVNFSNLPSGLTAHVTRTSDTTATLSFTGSALAHANANDINNFGVSFGNAAFVSNKASAVTGATRADIVLDFNDTPDTTAPVVTPRSDSYAENRPAGTVVGTVSATDAVGVTGFKFADTGTNTSANGYFAIGANGAITLTAAGAAAGSSANDYELTPHTFVLGVQARDAAGNWSTAQNVTLTVTNIDEVAPAFSSATTGRAAENQAILYTATATDNADFTDHAVTFSLAAGGDAGRLTIDANTGVVRLATGTLDFETKATYTFTVQARDASGNVRNQQVTIGVDNVDEVAPAFTSVVATSVPENQNVLYQAVATDLVDHTDGRVTYQLQPGGDAGLLAIDSATGIVKLASGNLDFETKASYTFIVQAQDASGNTRSQAVTVTVADIDETAPTVTITSDKSALIGGQTATLTFTFSEDVGASFTASDITVASGSLGPLVQIDATHYTAVYTPDAATQGGPVLISVAPGRVQDIAGNANGVGASLALTVDTAAPAIAGPAGFAIPENTTAVHQFTADETVTWSIAGGEDAAHFTLAADGTLAFAHAPDFEHPHDGATSGANTYVVDLRAVDGAGNATVRTITVTVLDVNEAPVASGPATGTGTVGTPMAPVAVEPFTDVDSATLHYSATRADGAPLPSWVTFDPATLTFAGTPPAGAQGTLVLTVTGSDGALAATTSVTLTIKDAATPVPTPSVTIGSMTRDTGASPQDFITADGSAGRTVSGTLSAPLGASQVVRVSFDGGATFATATVTGSTWAVVDTGTHGEGWTITAHVADTVTGATGGQASQQVVLDTFVPVPPQLTQPQVPVAPDPVAPPLAPAPAATAAASEPALPVLAPSAVLPASLALAPAGAEVTIPGSLASNDALMFGAAQRATVFALPAADGNAGLRQAAELSDIYTRTEGFRTVVAKSDDPALVLFQGVPDQFIDAGNRMALTVPSDAFVHTQPKAVVQLTATLQDGSPLPAWVTFTGQTGQFQGEPPPGLKGELRIKLTARDMDGREATALFRINVGQAKAVQGRSGLSEQLRQRGAVRGARG